MIEFTLIGIGTGNPDHLTQTAANAIRKADLILLPVKGGERGSLAALRKRIIAEQVDTQKHNTDYQEPTVVDCFLPDRDPAIMNYVERVALWHDGIADVWEQAIREHCADTPTGKVALLIWGDPSLYDSSLRIVDRLKSRLTLNYNVIPGITAIQALCAAHAITLNTVGEPVLITTGRKLVAEGWPEDVDTVVVMLDGNCSFTHFTHTDLHIWWGAYVAMEEELLASGPLSEVSDEIVTRRAEARKRYGWIMDIYLLRRV